MGQQENISFGLECLWKHFSVFNSIPRPSKHEEKIREYIIELSLRWDLEYKVDSVGNIVVYHPGNTLSEPILIQNHLDMVTDARPGVDFNPQKDSIQTYQEDGWLKAKGTTLGADNGIGCCAALALLELAHQFPEHTKIPPLEVLFTVDEETGLGGALGLDASMISAKKVINLDTEEWGSFYIGCAGGKDVEFTGEFEQEGFDSSLTTCICFNISDLKGGHSGLDIHRNRKNAIKLWSDILAPFVREFQLISFRGGRAHNIIPRDISSLLAVPSGKVDFFLSSLNDQVEKIKSDLGEDDASVRIFIDTVETVARKNALTAEKTVEFFELIEKFPHGAHGFLSNLPGVADEKLVGFSNNLAICILKEEKFYALTSYRFMQNGDNADFEKQLNQLADQFKLKARFGNGYPCWEINQENPLIQLAQEVYQDCHEGQSAQIKSIHAGLECGIILDKIQSNTAISFGPTIENAHSPDEKVEIASVEKFWFTLVQFLARLTI
jgi:dipeptidase D